MNLLTLVVNFAEGITSIFDILFFLVFYYGTRKDKSRYLITSVVLLAVVKIVTQVMTYCGWNETIVLVVYILDFIILYGIPIMYDRKKWLPNLVSFEIWLLLHDALLIGVTAIFENALHQTYNNNPTITSVYECAIYCLYHVATFTFMSVPATLILRKVLSYEKMCKNTLAQNLFWLFQTIVMTLWDSFVGGTAETIGLKLYIRMLAGDFIELIISFYIFTYIYNHHMRKELAYIEKVAEDQRKLYEDAVKNYDELSNVRHDLYNYMRTVELVKALGNNTEKYKEQMQERVKELVPQDYSDVHELNLMLGQAERICAEQNIELQIEVQKLNITETDCMKICMLLRNIIQNVILRCGGGEPEKVKLFIRQEEAVHISIEGDALKKHADRKGRKVIRDNRKFVKYILDKNDGIVVTGSY